MGQMFRSIAPAVVFGMLDEAYQYWWLHRAWGVYYDFNDVLLNIIAAALGLATVATLWPDVFEKDKNHATTPRRNDATKEEEVFVSEAEARRTPQPASASFNC